MLIYCPYTDREIPERETTPEHIIPLALGGSNDFTIRVDANANARIGSDVDGVLTRDFLISIRRREFGAKGHSRKAPAVVLKKTLMSPADRRVQLTLRGPQDPTVWDVREQRTLGPEEIAGQQFESSITIPRFSRLRLAAKVALSAGYYTYGDDFGRGCSTRTFVA